MESITNKFVFIALQAVSWVIFVALCIEAGGLLVNFIFSLLKPEMVSRLYQKLDLSQMYLANRTAYYVFYYVILAISILKQFLFYYVIRLMLKIDLAKPFSSFVARQIELISFYTLSIGLLSYVGSKLAKHFLNRGLDTTMLNPFWADSKAFIIMGLVVYIIATIFKKGVAIQSENDLTV